MPARRVPGTGFQPRDGILDVATDATGRSFVLDWNHGAIRILQVSNGRRLEERSRIDWAVLGLRNPNAIATRADGSIIVSDRGNSIKMLAPDPVLTVLDTVAVGLRPEAMCVLNDQIFVRGWQESGLILHQVGVRGTIARSFGNDYRHDVALVREQLSGGPLTCNSDAGVVVAAMEYFPWVSGYSTDGRRLWTTEIGEFAQMAITSGTTTARGIEAPFVEYAYRAVPNEVVVSLEDVGELIVLQTMVSDEEHGRERRVIHTYVLDAKSGRGAYSGTDIPRLADVRLPYVFAVDEHSHTGVSAYKLKELRDESEMAVQ